MLLGIEEAANAQRPLLDSPKFFICWKTEGSRSREKKTTRARALTRFLKRRKK